ncbi:hypocretin neuropeptide precursor-like [Carassius carassius]|uniref:hypocretin neuropeptide precursor-like n=1 Tax=Carassius carassius TaxID=217509 RepID=UPI002868F773|nr:hypocretin neuropeptide precursor-like [Carassius carassius]
MTFVYNKTRLMDCTAKRVQLLLFMALLAHLARDAEGAATCCSSASRSCKLYEMLCRSGPRNDTSVARHIGHLNNDAAVGILTLGKRRMGERRVQDRLRQLLHGSRNQAAGILTMGKRFEDGGHLPLMLAGGTVSAPLRLGLERPLKYLMPREPEDLDAYEKR